MTNIDVNAALNTLFICLTVFGAALLLYKFDWSRLQPAPQPPAPADDSFVRKAITQLQDSVETMRRAHDDMLYEHEKQLRVLTDARDSDREFFKASIEEVAAEGNRIRAAMATRAPMGRFTGFGGG